MKEKIKINILKKKKKNKKYMLDLQDRMEVEKI